MTNIIKYFKELVINTTVPFTGCGYSMDGSITEEINANKSIVSYKLSNISRDFLRDSNNLDATIDKALTTVSNELTTLDREGWITIYKSCSRYETVENITKFINDLTSDTLCSEFMVDLIGTIGTDPSKYNKMIYFNSLGTTSQHIKKWPCDRIGNGTSTMFIFKMNKLSPQKAIYVVEVHKYYYRDYPGKLNEFIKRENDRIGDSFFDN